MEMTRICLFTFSLYSLLFTVDSIFDADHFDRSPRIYRSIISDRGKKFNATENDTESLARATVGKVADDRGDDESSIDNSDDDDVDDWDDSESDQMQDFPLRSQHESNFPSPFGGRSNDRTVSGSTILFSGGMMLVIIGMVVAASMLYKSRRNNARLTLQTREEDDEDERTLAAPSGSPPTLLKTYNVDEYFASGRSTEGARRVKVRKSANN